METNFIDFKFGEHWASEYNLVAVSSGDRYSPSTYGNVNANGMSMLGKTGIYKWKTQINEKTISIDVAFDKVTPQQLVKIKNWLNPKEVHKLVLSEEPDKFHWCAVENDLDFKFLPFIRETVQVGNKEVITGVYCGEMSIKFLCVDNYGFGNYGTYGEVEVKPGTTYAQTEYKNKILPWITTSNLLETDKIFTTKDVYLKEFVEAESGDPSTSGISIDRPIKVYNAGNTEADLTIVSDLLIPKAGDPLTIQIESCKFTNQGEQIIAPVSTIQIEDFSHYKPFVEKFDGQLANWQLVIDSHLCEVYARHKSDKNKIVSLNKFNKNQSFLKLASCDFVDYMKPFPTLITAVENSAIENTIFNKISINSQQSYRLKNIKLEWEHTYL